MFTGCGTALVTPFARDFTLDEETLRRLIRRQIAEGIDFLVPCGTTGESPTLTRSEHLRVVEITVEEAHGKVPVLGGAGGYNTAEVISLAQELGHIGVDPQIADQARAPAQDRARPDRVGRAVEPCVHTLRFGNSDAAVVQRPSARDAVRH